MEMSVRGVLCVISDKKGNLPILQLELESLKWQFRKTQILSYKSSAYEDSVVVDQVARYQQVCC